MSRLLALPEEVQTLIWRHVFNIALSDLFEHEYFHLPYYFREMRAHAMEAIFPFHFFTHDSRAARKRHSLARLSQRSVARLSQRMAGKKAPYLDDLGAPPTLARPCDQDQSEGSSCSPWRVRVRGAGGADLLPLPRREAILRQCPVRRPI